MKREKECNLMDLKKWIQQWDNDSIFIQQHFYGCVFSIKSWGLFLSLWDLSLFFVLLERIYLTNSEYISLTLDPVLAEHSKY